MNNTKKIWLVIIVLVVIGSIWYLESVKVHSSANGQPVQTLNVDSASSTELTANATSTSVASGTTQAPAQISAALAAIAAGGVGGMGGCADGLGASATRDGWRCHKRS